MLNKSLYLLTDEIFGKCYINSCILETNVVSICNLILIFCLGGGSPSRYNLSAKDEMHLDMFGGSKTYENSNDPENEARNR